MVVTACKYDPAFDMKPVDSFGWIDLAVAWVNKTVPSDSGATDSMYNGLDDVDAIGGKPSDVFDMYKYGESVSSTVGDGDESQ